jgi:predicted RNA-binding protein with PUA-like domain
MAGKPNHWLVKSEPDCFSIQHLARSPRRTTCWSGVRNYQARNFMRAMQVGDRVLFYHSSADPPAVAGTATVVRAAYPDTTALDSKDDHYDPKSTRENPIWDMVDLRFEQAFDEPIPIGVLREQPGLANMELLKRGSRLSVQPVRPDEFEIVLRLAEKRPGSKKSAAKPQRAAKAPASAARKSVSGSKRKPSSTRLK